MDFTYFPPLVNSVFLLVTTVTSTPNLSIGGDKGLQVTESFD